MLNSEGRYILFFPFRFSLSFSSLCEHLPLSSLPTIVTLLLSLPDNYCPFISFTILSYILLFHPFPSSPPFPFHFISFHFISFLPLLFLFYLFSLLILLLILSYLFFASIVSSFPAFSAHFFSFYSSLFSVSLLSSPNSLQHFYFAHSFLPFAVILEISSKKVVFPIPFGPLS